MIRKLPVKKVVAAIKADPDFNMSYWDHCLMPAIVRAAGGKINSDYSLDEPFEFDGITIGDDNGTCWVWDACEQILTHLGADRDEIQYTLPFVSQWPERYQQLAIVETNNPDMWHECPQTAIKFIKWWWVNNLTK